MREFARRVPQDERVHDALLIVGHGMMLAWRRPTRWSVVIEIFSGLVTK